MKIDSSIKLSKCFHIYYDSIFQFVPVRKCTVAMDFLGGNTVLDKITKYFLNVRITSKQLINTRIVEKYIYSRLDVHKIKCMQMQKETNAKKQNKNW